MTKKQGAMPEKLPHLAGANHHWVVWAVGWKRPLTRYHARTGKAFTRSRGRATRTFCGRTIPRGLTRVYEMTVPNTLVELCASCCLSVTHRSAP